MRIAFLSIMLACALLPPILVAQESVTIDSRTFGAIEARHIGPAVMSGRIATLDVINSDPRIIYVGAASGGVWKSVNGGVEFKPIFDKYTQSIGGISIDQARPDTVWVGTGETWVRNSVSVGTGIYKTTDGGENWENMGLLNSERINKILINPNNPDVVYVSVLGKLWSDSEERGVYRTTDGGKTWKRMLYVNPRTGCADLAMDPTNPNVLYAAMWEFRRMPYHFTSGGPGSGLFKTTNGGTTWNKLTNGLPEGDLGRIAIAVAPSKPNVVYATVEANKSGFYRSSDYGATWTSMTTNLDVVRRPFYFSLLVIDPQDHNRIFKPGFALNVSADSGVSWDTRGGGVHSDLHALWIEPTKPAHLLLGTDGGVYESMDGGGSWRMFLNLPVSQFYHVAYDVERPYNVYGGLQDNGSWMGPSQSPGGIENRDWQPVGMGDGFNAFPDPKNKDIIYWQYQGGNVFRRNNVTKEAKAIEPYRKADEPEYRWNWNTPITFGMKSGALYVGSQYLFRSIDRGDSWQRISPDLTTNDPTKQKQKETGGLTLDNSTAENHCTIFTISESPQNAAVVWAGTDDGNLQVTRDAGKTWTNTASKIPGLPPGTWCMCVSASNKLAGTAFAAFSGHQTGDMDAYVFKTTDFGEHWMSIVTDSIRGFAHVIREDLVNPNLLFLGTEFGLYVSVDGGKQWARFTGNLPQVPIYDIAIHPREGDLILASHGRGIIIIDDIAPLRAITSEALNADLFIFPSRPIEIRIPKFEQEFPGDQEFVGDNPTESATITYYLRKRHVFGDLNVEIFSPDGKLLKTLPGGKYKGLNRVKWAMRMKPPKVTPSPTLAGYALFGPMVSEGKYTFRIVQQDKTSNGSFTLVPDASVPHTAADRKLQYVTTMKLYNMQSDLTYVADAIADLRDRSTERAAKLDSTDALCASLKSFAHRLDSLYKTLLIRYEGAGLTSEERLREKVVGLYGVVSNYSGKPTQSQLDQVQVLEKEITAADAAFTKIHEKEIVALNAQLSQKNLDPLVVMTRAAFDKKEGIEAASKQLLRQLPLMNTLRFW